MACIYQTVIKDGYSIVLVPHNMSNVSVSLISNTKKCVEKNVSQLWRIRIEYNKSKFLEKIRLKSVKNFTLDKITTPTLHLCTYLLFSRYTLLKSLRKVLYFISTNEQSKMRIRHLESFCLYFCSQRSSFCSQKMNIRQQIEVNKPPPRFELGTLQVKISHLLRLIKYDFFPVAKNVVSH